MINISGEKIIQHIEKTLNVKIPNYGYLAGQSVASAIFELMNLPFIPVYKDIDIFYDYYELINIMSIEEKKYIEFIKKYKNHYNNKIDFETIDFKENSIEYNFLNQNIFNDNKRIILNSMKKYNLFLSYNKDLFNYIIINFYSENKMDQIKTLIQDFDLNSVQVGINLKNKELYYTKSFYDFLSHGNFQVLNYASPHHSVIRMFDKEKILKNKNYSFEKELIKLATVINISNNISDKTFPFFGKEKYFQYTKNHKIQEHFNLVPDFEHPIYKLESIFETGFENDISKYLDKIEKKYFIDNKKNKILKFVLTYHEKIFDHVLKSKKTYFILNPLFFENENRIKEEINSFSKEEQTFFDQNIGIIKSIFSKKNKKFKLEEIKEIVTDIKEYYSSIPQKNLINEIEIYKPNIEEIIKIYFNNLSIIKNKIPIFKIILTSPKTSKNVLFYLDENKKIRTLDPKTEIDKIENFLSKTKKDYFHEFLIFEN